jgi:glycosyltransferase 2 family protein
MIGAHHTPAASRGRLVIALRWLAGLIVLGLLLHFLPLAPLRAAIARVPLTRFVTILIGYLLAHGIGVAKWRMVVNSAGAELDLGTSAQCYAGGLFGTLFLPSIIGGDVVRLAVGLRRSPRPAAVLTGNVADRFIDVGAQAALVLAGLILLPGSLPAQLQIPQRGILWMGSGAIVLLLAIAIVSQRRLLGGRSFHFRRRLAHLRHALRGVSRRPHILILGWVLGVCIQFSFLVLTALLAISCGLVLPLRVWLFAWPLAKLAAVLPLTQGGIGVREAALVALLAPFGAAGPVVLAAGLVWEGVIIAGGLIAGAVAFLLRKSRSPVSAR